MRYSRLVFGLGAALALGAAAWGTRERWRPWFAGAAAPPAAPAAASPAALASVALTDQTIKSLGLVSKPVRVETSWRTLRVPGTVIDRPGFSDRTVSAPVAAVVARLHVATGELVAPGAPLATLRLVSESVQSAQSDLHKASEDLKILAEQLATLTPLARQGAVPEVRLVELEQQIRRQKAAAAAVRHDLRARGLSDDQVRGVEAGRFASEVVVVAPAPRSDVPATEPPVLFEVQAVKTDLGQQVLPGQPLAELADHRQLLIEGRAFKHEAGSVEAAALQRWPVAVEFLAAPNLDWPAAPTAFPIRAFGNNVDPASRTFPFTLELVNQSKTLPAEGRPFLAWRHRPGEKVRLSVPVEKLANVVVVPPDAVTRDGNEHVVFRHNGNVFERKSVQVVVEERDRVVLANDGAVLPGSYVVQNQAAALLRALKAQAPKPATAGGHWHADGSFHATPHGKEDE